MTKQNSRKDSEFRIAVAGAGIAGLTAAIALVRLLPSNISVTIFEQATQLRAVGASIGIGPNGLRTLFEIGVDQALINEVAFRQPSGHPFIYLHYLTGETLVETDHHTVTEDRDNMARFHRAHLQKVLLDSLPDSVTLKLGSKVQSISSGEDESISVSFQDGSAFEADLLVAADGIHSAVRKILVPDHNLLWTGEVLFRSTFDKSLLDHIPDLPEDAVFYCGPEENFLFTSRLGTRGDFSLRFVEARMFVIHAYTAQGKNQYTIVGQVQSDPDGLPNPYRTSKWNTEGDIAQMRNLYKGWHPAVQKVLEATPNMRLYPNHIGTPLPSLVFQDRIALIGDAGHTHGGAYASGGSLAMNDAHAIALALAYVWPAGNGMKPDSAQVARALAIYDRTRRPHVNKLIETVQLGLQGRHERLRDSQRAAESDEELRERVHRQSDVAWIAEHDVKAAFRASTAVDVAKL